jgi:hypothetical protein
LEDHGTARYVTQIFETIVESTGQNRVQIATPNLRHFLMSAFDGVAQSNSILFTRDGQVRVEGDYNQLLALTDIDSAVELGAAATAHIMPDLGNNNPATWTGGRQEVKIVGATAASLAHFTEMGAEPVSPEEYATVSEIEANAIAEGIASSPMPFAEIIGPIDARKVLSVDRSVTVNVAPSVPPNRERAAVQAGPQPTKVATPHVRRRR